MDWNALDIISKSDLPNYWQVTLTSSKVLTNCDLTVCIELVDRSGAWMWLTSWGGEFFCFNSLLKVLNLLICTIYIEAKVSQICSSLPNSPFTKYKMMTRTNFPSVSDSIFCFLIILSGSYSLSQTSPKDSLSHPLHLDVFECCRDIFLEKRLLFSHFWYL